MAGDYIKSNTSIYFTTCHLTLISQYFNPNTAVFLTLTLWKFNHRKSRLNTGVNEGNSAASFCLQAAALVPDKFCNFYLLKKHKFINNLAITKAIKNEHGFGILRILEIFDVGLTKLKNYQISLNKISHRCLLTTKLFSG